MDTTMIQSIFHNICTLNVNNVHTTESKDMVIKLLDELSKLDSLDMSQLEMVDSLFFLYASTDICKNIIEFMNITLNKDMVNSDDVMRMVYMYDNSTLVRNMTFKIYKSNFELFTLYNRWGAERPHHDISNYMNLKLIKDVEYLKSAYEMNYKDKHDMVITTIKSRYGSDVIINNPLEYIIWYNRVHDELLCSEAKMYIYIKLYEYNSDETFKDFSILLKEVSRMNVKEMIPIYESGLGSLIGSIVLSELDNKGCSGIDMDELDSICEEIGYYDGSSFVSENMRPDILYDIMKRHFNIPILDDRRRQNFLDRISELNENFVEYKLVPDFSSGNLVANVINRLDENIGLIGVTKHKSDLELSFINASHNNYICDLNIGLLKEVAARMENEIIPHFTVYIQEDLIDGIRSLAGKVKEVGDDVSRKLNKVVDTAIKQLKNIFTTDDREEIIKGGLPKASRLLKMTLVHVAIIGINPALGIVAILVNYCMSKRANNKARSKILNELKAELEIIEEKIKDADGDKNAKYKLMRIRQQINKDIDRIRYKQNLDD